MRAKFVNEFERGLDPKASLGIGLLHTQNFETVDQFTDYIIKTLNIILQNNIPKNISRSKYNGIIDPACYEAIIEFFEKRNDIFCGITDNGIIYPEYYLRYTLGAVDKNDHKWSNWIL